MDFSKWRFLECDKGCAHLPTSEVCANYCMHNIHLDKWCRECRNLCGVVNARPDDNQERL